MNRPAPTERPSRTAELVAFLRAVETARAPERRLIDDPYAIRFLRAAGSALGRLDPAGLPARALARALEFPFGTTSFVALRHRVIDEQLERALASGLEQVVIVGAGLESRAKRFQTHSSTARFFEIDHPSVSRVKRQVYERTGGKPPRLALIALDLAQEPLAPALVAAGFERHATTAFVWEGVTYYLELEQIERSLEAFVELGGKGTHVWFDGRFALRSGRLLSRGALAFGRACLRALGEPLRSRFERQGDASPRALLARAGLELDGLVGAERFATRLEDLGRRTRIDDAWFVALGRGCA